MLRGYQPSIATDPSKASQGTNPTTGGLFGRGSYSNDNKFFAIISTMNDIDYITDYIITTWQNLFKES